MDDINEVSQLVVWERQTRVRGLDKENLSTYKNDGTITTSWMSGLVKDFVGQRPVDYRESLPLVSRVGTPVIHLKRNRAYVELPAMTDHWQMVNGTEAVLTSYMRLIYLVEKIEGTWKIADMTAINESDKLEPAIPGEDLKINFDQVRNFRRSYRWLAYTRILAGGQIDQDGIGTDRPETVQPIYQRAEEWINQ